MATAPTYPATSPRVHYAKRLVDSDSTNVVDLIDNSGGSVAVKIEALTICTDNTADRVYKFWYYDGSVAHLLGSVTVPDLSGTNGVTDPRVNVLSTTGVAGPDGVPCMWVGAGKKLQVSLDSALATGKYGWVVARCVPYT